MTMTYGARLCRDGWKPVVWLTESNGRKHGCKIGQCSFEDQESARLFALAALLGCKWRFRDRIGVKSA